jgi:hypothetical protein
MKNSNNHNIISKLLKLIKFSIQFGNLKKNRERNVSIVSLILKKIPSCPFQLIFQVQFIQKSSNLKKNRGKNVSNVYLILKLSLLSNLHTQVQVCPKSGNLKKIKKETLITFL